ncbi:hypothetical protein [Herpetosiphon giganteus]|uniref:hypothetical protein n=1 Tax=Herpetosiphon giganteus TaxID=2029754 RepID=UPI00195B9F72|nr:hypothetical protein [Herpetosiphon giganteus]MBM7845920.1 hypothetical protein [Herpetosiphon giganteus]
MGTTFTTLHVLGDQTTSTTLRHRLVETLRARVLTEGFVDAATDAPSVDRIICVSPTGDSGWITLDGGVTADFGDDALQTCAQELSATLRTTVLIASAFDSDLLQLWLYQQGILVDHYVSDPDALSPRLPRRRWKEVAGHAKRWEDLLMPTASSPMLQELFDSRPIFAETTFYAMAPLLGINPRWCGGLEAAADVLQLRFQSTQVPHHRTPIQGEPQLLRGGHPMSVEGMVGHRVAVTWMVRSAGGPGYGLVVGVDGTAVTMGLIRLESISTWVADPERHQHFNHVLQDDERDQRVTVEFPDLLLPPDRVGSHLRPEAWNWRAIFHDQAHATMTVRVTGIVLAAGAGRLSLETRLLTTAAATTTLDLPCVTHPAARSPLRMAERSAMAQRRVPDEALMGYLLQLNTPQILQAHLVLPPTVHASAAFLDGLERWHTALDPDQRAHYRINARTALDQRSTTTKMRSRTMSAGKRWKRLRSTLQGTSMIRVTLEAPPTPPRMLDLDNLVDTNYGMGRAGGMVERMSILLQHTPDDSAPQLNLWVDLRRATPDRQEFLIAHLTGIIDALFATYNGVQAYLARWRNVPYSLDSNPYELVCGVHGQITMRYAWCARFLRSVTERMWIGPTLLDQLPSPQMLADYAVVTPVGDGIRVTVASPTQLDALEQVLLPIVPSEGDWQQAVEARYAKRRA